MHVKIDANKLAQVIVNDEEESAMMGACESEFPIGVVGEYVVLIKLQRVADYKNEVGSLYIPDCATGIMEVTK